MKCWVERHAVRWSEGGGGGGGITACRLGIVRAAAGGRG